MEYIFFDIECANCFGGRGKICSFGYVITDEQFNVKEKNDILINPHSKFHLYGSGNRPGIVLGYDEDEFFSSPDFKVYYPTIRNLLTRDNTMIFGFAVMSDAGFLKSECERFHREMFDYNFIDIQRIYTDYKGLDNTPGLIKCAAEYGVTETQDVHKSDDDSYFTMRVLKGLCEETGLTPRELVERYPLSKCWSLYGELDSEYIHHKEQEKANKLSKMEKLTGSLRANWIHSDEEHANEFSMYYKRVFIDYDANTSLSGKRVCFSILYEEYHFAEMMNLVSLLAKMGAKYVRNAFNADIFVKYDIFAKNGTRYRCYREEKAHRAINEGKELEIIDISDLLDILGTDENEIKNLTRSSLSPIKVKKYASL